jgi:hypothetical protein
MHTRLITVALPLVVIAAAACSGAPAGDTATSSDSLSVRCPPGGCRVPPPPPPPPPPSFASEVSTITASANGDYANFVTIPLGTDHFCYLTALEGSADDPNALVKLFVANGGWQLIVDHQLTASVGCVPVSAMGAAADAELSVPEGWHLYQQSGEQDASLYSYMHSMCAISMLRSPFPDAQHQVSIDISWPNWELVTVNMEGAAMCYSLGAGVLARVDANAWTTQKAAPDQRLIPVEDGVCMLTLLQGDTSGNQNADIRIYSDGTYWMLTGGDSGINASVSCYRFTGH